MGRPILYDTTHFVSRLPVGTPAGIDRIDLEYGRHFALGHPDFAGGLHLGFVSPRVVGRGRVRRLVARLGERWREDFSPDADPAFTAARDWILGRGAGDRIVERAMPLPQALRLRAEQAVTGSIVDPFRRVPADAIYIATAQYGMEHPYFYRWLAKRRDVRAVFVAHDLIPVDYPEFFKAGKLDRFAHVPRTMARFGAGVIVSSQAVKERLGAHFAGLGRRDLPIHVEPFPPPVAFGAPVEPDADLAGLPYFVVCGTIEPRKNHLLLLHAWASALERGAAMPRLLVVGRRGWENEQVVDMLERSRRLGGHVLEVGGMSTPGLRHLLAHSSGLLMPSYAEGYGLPVVEALALKVPVIASDIPVFAEVSQGCATLIHPTDGRGWLEAILALADHASPAAQAARAAAARYRAPGWAAYFASVDGFLKSL